MITIDCHRKIVSENGMTPVIGSRRLRQARRIGLQLRGRRGQAHRPGRAEAEIGGGAGSAVVHVQFARARASARTSSPPKISSSPS